MKIYGNRGLGNILKKILQVFVLLGIIFLIALYWIIRSLNLKFDMVIILLYPLGILFLYLTYQFIKLFDSLKLKNPFCNANVKILRNGMITSFIISFLLLIILLLAIFIYNYYSLGIKISLGFLVILFFGVAVALYLLSKLFSQATAYKEENDLTI